VRLGGAARVPADEKQFAALLVSGDVTEVVCDGGEQT